ncbi:hypothetical protein IAC76_04155 [Spirochaetes bacterium]|uniref:Uncharacterized protein n=1 Tax=Candidatus Scatousia excrementipullorum TaxID=2840936 RepID=A0A9D9DPU0_9BACT|nr:hypothetical protein [Candidatus Scatousia excrementipullorum]
MKNFLIFAAVMFVVIIAAFDTRSVLKEIAANTPTQVEMKPDLNKSSGEGVEKKFDAQAPVDNGLSQPNEQNKDKNLYTNPVQRPQKGISPTITPRRY